MILALSFVVAAILIYLAGRADGRLAEQRAAVLPSIAIVQTLTRSQQRVLRRNRAELNRSLSDRMN